MYENTLHSISLHKHVYIYNKNRQTLEQHNSLYSLLIKSISYKILSLSFKYYATVYNFCSHIKIIPPEKPWKDFKTQLGYLFPQSCKVLASAK